MVDGWRATRAFPKGEKKQKRDNHQPTTNQQPTTTFFQEGKGEDKEGAPTANRQRRAFFAFAFFTEGVVGGCRSSRLLLYFLVVVGWWLVVGCRAFIPLRGFLGAAVFGCQLSVGCHAFFQKGAVDGRMCPAAIPGLTLDSSASWVLKICILAEPPR